MNPIDPTTALRIVMNAFACATATLHRLNPATGQLELVCHIGIPDVVLDRIRAIPVGKGMAGLAAQRREPVQVCNLQTDDSGVVKPGAKMTGMEGAIAVPMLVDGAVVGVLGVAKSVAYDFTASEKQALLIVASILARLCF
jgi:L-methionine (R)-S-oxide reductase